MKIARPEATKKHRFAGSLSINNQLNTPKASQAHKDANYQENVEDPDALKQALESIPLKNYSDYEITIETKSQYNDALFADESALEQALTQSAQQQTTTAPKTTATAQITAKITPALQPRDFTALLSTHAKKLSQQLQATHSTPIATDNSGRLSIINNAINHSPARKPIPPSDEAILFEQLIDQIAAEQARLLAEKKQQTCPASTSTPTKTDEAHSKLAYFSKKIKAKSKELGQMSKEKFNQSKAELDEYLGRTLPERSLALEILLPVLKAKPDQADIISPHEITTLFTARGKSLIFMLEKSDHHLQLLAKTALSNRKRSQVLNAFAPLLAEKIKAVIAMFERKPCADDEKRAEMVDIAQSALRQLITGYKQIYVDLYESSNLIYGPQRKTANEIAFVLLDCLCLEQDLCNTLHLPLPNGSAKTVNKIFYALSLYEPQLLSEPKESINSPHEINLIQLFIRYQIGVAFNLSNLSSSLYRVLHAYLQHNQHHLQLIPLCISNQLSEVKPGQQLWQINHDSSNPVLITPTDIIQGKPSYPPLYVKIQDFFNQIKKDFVECLKLRIANKNSHSCPALKETTIDQKILLLSALNQCVKNNETHQRLPVYSTYNAIELTAISGYKPCISYAEFDYALSKQGPLVPGQPLIGLPPKPSLSKSEWLCAVEDKQQLQLQISEGKIGINLDIGELLLLIQTSEKTNSAEKDDSPKTRLILSRITTMTRAQQGRQSICAEILAENFTPVRFKHNASNYTGLLLQSDQQHLLITPPQLHLASGSQLVISFADESQAIIAIEGLATILSEAQCFKLY